MTDLLILLLKPMLFFVYNPKKYWYLFLPAILGLFADVVMNNTTVPLVLGGGWWQEWTFSTRLERLCVKDDDEIITKALCIEIAKAINRVDPAHSHIQAVLAHE